MQIFVVVKNVLKHFNISEAFNVIMNQNSIEILCIFKFIIHFDDIIITETIDTPNFSLHGTNV